MAKNHEPSDAPAARTTATTLLKSLSEGIRTIVTVTERLNDVRTETVALRNDLKRLAESLYQIAGRLDGIDNRFAEVDKRVDLMIKVSIDQELDRRLNNRTRPRAKK